jgi:hypothetical protein
MPADVIKYRDRYRYQLAERYTILLNIKGKVCLDRWFDLAEDGTLTIEAGYAWDGASGPAIDTKTIIRGSLVHDVLYQAMREGLLPMSYRKAADEEFKRVCKDAGMSRVRSWYTFLAVRKFGDDALKGGPKPVLTAP